MHLVVEAAVACAAVTDPTFGQTLMYRLNRVFVRCCRMRGFEETEQDYGLQRV